jgi:hypothetical protein
MTDYDIQEYAEKYKKVELITIKQSKTSIKDKERERNIFQWIAK